MSRIAIPGLFVVCLAAAVTAPQKAAKPKAETKAAKITRALFAAPGSIARTAKVIDRDENGNETVLREGTGGFTCFPGHPAVIDDIAYCANADALQWEADWHGHKPKPTNTQPGIEYMLAGGHVQKRDGPLRHFGHALHGSSPLDNFVAVRPGNNGPADAIQADGNLDHVGWYTLLPSHDQPASLSRRELLAGAQNLFATDDRVLSGLLLSDEQTGD
jgi:hypothetical protein